MKRNLITALIYCILGILLLIIGFVWKGSGQAYLTGISMLSCGVAFELVALVYLINHLRESKR